MRVRAGLVCVLAAVGAIAIGCGDDGGGGESEASSGNPPLEAQVRVTRDGYEPKNVKILLGGTVTFVNDDEEGSHTAETGELPGGDGPKDVTDSNEFDTHVLSWGEPYPVTFHKPGKVTYYDALSDLSGTVEVVPKAP